MLRQTAAKKWWAEQNARRLWSLLLKNERGRANAAGLSAKDYPEYDPENINTDHKNTAEVGKGKILRTKRMSNPIGRLMTAPRSQSPAGVSRHRNPNTRKQNKQSQLSSFLLQYTTAQYLMSRSQET